MGVEIEVDAVPGLMNRLRELREQKGLSQEKLAELIGVSHSTIQRLESGGMKMTDEYLAALSDALHCHPAEIITDVGAIARTERERRALQIVRDMDQDAAESWLTTGRHLARK